MDNDGFVVAEIFNPAVPHALLEEIWSWRCDGVSMEDAATRLRPRIVPPGYLFNTWKPGTNTYCVWTLLHIVSKFTLIAVLHSTIADCSR